VTHGLAGVTAASPSRIGAVMLMCIPSGCLAPLACLSFAGADPLAAPAMIGPTCAGNCHQSQRTLPTKGMEGAWNEDAAVKAGQDALRREATPEEVAPSVSPRLQETRCLECDGLSCNCTGHELVWRIRHGGATVDWGCRILGPGSGGRRHRSLPADLGQLMYPLPLLQRSRWETEVGLKQVIRAWYGEVRESAARKVKQREKRSQRRHDKKQREKEESKEGHERFKAEFNQCQAASNQNDPAPRAQDVTDGVDEEKERQRREAVKAQLQDEKARLEREKTQLQDEKARIERDKAKVQDQKAKFWGKLMEASPIMSPLFQMLKEAALIMQRSESLGKLGREKLLQILLDETLAFLHEVLDGWNGVAVTQIQIRRALAKIPKDGSSGSGHRP